MTQASLWAAMDDGIGEFTFADAGWIEAARTVLQGLVERAADRLAGVGVFTLCEVAHNPPAYLKCGGALAWHARFEGAKVTVGEGELPASDCDFKIQGDHSILSNLARLQSMGRDPAVVAAARARLLRQSRWEVHGDLPSHPGLAWVLEALHDAMAPLTLPRFVFMTPDWVGVARRILTTRAQSEKHAPEIAGIDYVFSEEFTDTPRYAFPDGAHGGFWARFRQGRVIVGAGPLPAEMGPADALTLGALTPVFPVGRTVNSALSDADKADLEAYRKAAFRFDNAAGRPPVTQTSPSGRGPMPPALGRVFLPLHDELSKRTSGELPSDFDPGIRPEWGTPRGFDRDPAYEPSWLRYDRVDIHGHPLSEAVRTG